MPQKQEFLAFVEKQTAKSLVNNNPKSPDLLPKPIRREFSNKLSYWKYQFDGTFWVFHGTKSPTHTTCSGDRCYPLILVFSWIHKEDAEEPEGLQLPRAMHSQIRTWRGYAIASCIAANDSAWLLRHLLKSAISQGFLHLHYPVAKSD